MIKDNQKGFNRFHVALDAAVTAASYFLAWYLMLEARIFPVQGEVLAPQYYFVALSFIVPVYLVLYGVFHLYTPKRVQGRRVEFANICKANAIGLLLFTMVLFAIRNLATLMERPRALQEKIFQHLFEAAEIAKFRPEERYEYEESLKVYRDWFSVIKTAESKGEQRGLEKGRQEGLQEGERRAVLSTARKLKQMGLPAADITRATGLSEDEIRLL